VIDSQSVKASEPGGLRGYDVGKKIKGRKRHIPTDTIGLAVGRIDHTADIPDRDGAPALTSNASVARESTFSCSTFSLIQSPPDAIMW
jgi:putative transposase